jgi:para-nitrobenzyl esterase
MLLALAGTLCLILTEMVTAFVCSPGTATAAPVIVTDQGPLRGLTLAGENKYLGIPYASPPVGNLRWLPPRPPSRFKGVFQATQFGNFCTQPDGFGGTFGSEDCLTLNIYTPTEKKNQDGHLPVMVRIHGGGLVTGGGGFGDPTRMVEQGGIIAVSINYRLGFLGFFAHPAIDAEGHLNGNYGLMDQQMALNWIQRNIEAFGGDPSRVTISGQSAGGQSVYANLASPTAARLFSGAIAESGAYVEFQDYYNFIVPLAQGETLGGPGVPAGTTIAANVGCSSLTAECLRSVSASTIIEQDPATATLYPFVDGTILTKTPSAAFASGEFNHVPVITGGTHDEWRLQVATQYDANGHPLVTPSDYQNATVALWGPSLGPILYTSLYPLANYPSPGIALGASGTDGIFACPERNSVRLLSAYVPTYAYEFNDENAYLVFNQFPSPPYPPITFPLGAAHFAEVPYLLELFSTPSIFTPDQQQLSDTMIGYWTQFAKNGNPNSEGAPNWPLYNGTAQLQSLLPPKPQLESDSSFDADHKCSSFWDTF